jgi:hypothetical protein
MSSMHLFPSLASCLPLGMLSTGVGSLVVRPNIAFKPKLHRYAVNMAEKACHVASYALQFGLT